jgi:C_GCAxxG_C_C family probable redox protein
MTRKERAIALFMEGANCAQAVLVAFADLCDLEQKTAYRLAAPFGAGLGRQREVCGAVSGMCMVLGFLYGYDDRSDASAKAEHYRLVQELCNAFKAEFGTIVCRELLGEKRATTHPEPDARTAEYYRVRPCAHQVGVAAGILEDYINAHPVTK